MATLQLTFKDIREEVQRYLGYGRHTGFDSISEDPRGDVLSCIERGLRQFYNPAPLPNETSSHEWSFLRSESVVATVAPYTAGLVSGSAGSTAVAGGSTTFTSAMVGRLFIAGEQVRDVATFSSTTLIGLDRALDTALSSSSYEIIANEYDLPSDFGGIKGAINFKDGDGYVPLQLVNESSIRMMRAREEIRKDRPEFAAIIPKTADNDTTSAQAFQLSVYPFPDKVYDLYFSYTVLPNSIADDTASSSHDSNVPLGGMVHSETILAACLAVAEQIVDEFNNPGKMQARYQERLAASISFDRRNMLPDGFGYNADNSDRKIDLPSRRRIQTVSYNNTVYP